MAFRFRICQNDTTAALRDLFNATPMKVPDASVQPFMVIAEKRGKTERRGELRHLLTNNLEIPIRLKEADVSNVNLEKTRSMDWDFGIKILDGIFQGFKLPSGEISSQLDNAKEISLSFNNVKRKFIDKNELGTSLIGRLLDLSHPSARIFLKDGYNLLLVTDVIVSKSFGINFTKTINNQEKIEAPTIQQIIDKANLEIKVKAESNNSISFEGSEYLTFAFSCVKLNIDPDTGALYVGSAVTTKESTRGESAGADQSPQPVELDDDVFEPGMLEWD